MSELECLSNRNSSVESSRCVAPESLVVLTETLRNIFMGIFIVVSVFSLIGNCAAIYSISKRKYRFIQKTCIISLACSDILSTVIIATNNLETFSHECIVWTLGSFLCSFVPMCQMAGILASSTALVCIAMDRYRNVVHALNKRWNPSPSFCICATVILWLISFAASYPLYSFFMQEEILLLYLNDDEVLPFTTVPAHMCISFEKKPIMTYYIVMVIIIFLPLLIVFLWFYYNIAALVWKHRKPLSTMFNKKETSNLENSMSTSKSIEYQDKHSKTKKQDIRVEKKIRTCKIIVTLMIVFIVCRLPYFAVYILKLSITNDKTGLWMWTLNYIFTALHIVNCCLNPLLYTFLNQTLTVWVKIKKSVKVLTWDICCFCFSNTEFREFERENPFTGEYEQKSNRNSKVKFEDNAQHIRAKY